MVILLFAATMNPSEGLGKPPSAHHFEPHSDEGTEQCEKSVHHPLFTDALSLGYSNRFMRQQRFLRTRVMCIFHSKAERGISSARSTPTLLHARTERVRRTVADTPGGTGYSKSSRSNTFSTSPGSVTNS